MLQNQPVVYASFLAFEICVGVFWPSLSTMRSKYIPEASTNDCFIACLLLRAIVKKFSKLVNI